MAADDRKDSPALPESAGRHSCPAPTTVIIAGVHKAGTTSLFEYLARHPRICTARIKELRYFSRIARDGREPDMREYDGYFDYRDKARYRLEGSPNYVCSGVKVAELIKSSLPGAKIIVILRDPIERLLSLYDRAVAHSDLPRELSFHDYVVASLKWRPGDDEHYVYTRGLRDGFYIEHLRPWHALFGDDLKILFFDDLKADSRRVTRQVCEWLDLDTSYLQTQPFEVENRTLHYRFFKIHRHVTRFYMASEAYWRRHPRLKRAIRKVYNRVNGGRVNRPPIGRETLEMLESVYDPCNAELRDFLIARKTPLPRWLQ